ncbi:unnamed protein product [Diabrotica balteata]|uniref:Uncharacterized protein n=1 Tax=Diabrotica balteata TaxID=107213 RepID=A0A9N9XEG7_DIABA|nr:unnamed protein product [Diabrotica balteata]
MGGYKPQKSLSDADKVKSDSEWVSVHHKKRQRNDDGPELKSTKQATLKDYWLRKTVLTSNKYEALKNDKPSKEVEMLEDQKDEQPPLIFIEHVDYIKPLQELLQQITAENEQSSSNNVSIKCDSVELTDVESASYPGPSGSKESNLHVLKPALSSPVNLKENTHLLNVLASEVTSSDNLSSGSSNL